VLELTQGATVGDLSREVLSRFPNLLGDPSRLVVAVNDEFRDRDFVLHDGDEAALIPPVSGGAT
jgi:molybdopterin converting factor small subunit